MNPKTEPSGTYVVELVALVVIRLFGAILFATVLIFYFGAIYIFNELAMASVSAIVTSVFWGIDAILKRFGYPWPAHMMETEQSCQASWLRNHPRRADLRNWTR